MKDVDRALKAQAEAMEALVERNGEQSRRILDLEQKLAGRAPGTGGGYGEYGGDPALELAGVIVNSEGNQRFQKKQTNVYVVDFPARHLKNTIINAVGGSQPLVPSDRGPGYIVYAPQQRLAIRALFRQVSTTSDLIERAVESTFTNNAAPQGGDSSPTGSGEGALKAQSDMTFTLQQVPLIQYAHYIVASRQVLSDATLLAGHLNSRLLYGLNLKEETDFLTGTGASGTVNGINNQATAFTGGVTNATRLDTLARAMNQLQRSNYEPSAFILNPADWLAVMLEKDSQNRYMFSDPAAVTMPQLWGLPVVVTPSQTAGNFTCLDAARLGFVADRETATVRISENVNDAFIRNLVHILAEKRCTLVVELGGAAVYGSLTNVG